MTNQIGDQDMTKAEPEFDAHRACGGDGPAPHERPPTWVDRDAPVVFRIETDPTTGVVAVVRNGSVRGDLFVEDLRRLRSLEVAAALGDTEAGEALADIRDRLRRALGPVMRRDHDAGGNTVEGGPVMRELRATDGSETPNRFLPMGLAPAPFTWGPPEAPAPATIGFLSDGTEDEGSTVISETDPEGDVIASVKDL